MGKLCVSLMALVAVFFVSCSTETDIIEENDGGKDVTLTISTSPLTKSLDASQVGQKAPIVDTKDLYVYFMDASSNTVASYKLTDTQIGEIKKSTGFKFTNLDPSVASVYVVANVPKTGVTMPTAPTTTTLDAVNLTVMNIADQQTANAASVVLANTGKKVESTFTKTGNASNGNAQFTATVVLTPIVSRIQIAKVSVDTDGTISSFTLEGIYIDNFYTTMSIGGAFSTDISNAGNIALLESSILKDVNAEGMVQNPGNVSPTQVSPLQVYGYQLFPTKAPEAPADQLSNVPYIILKLTHVKKSSTATRDISDSETYYVAVKAYKTDVTPPTASTTITEFLAGKIYTIANIPVSEKNLVTDPTKSLINVTVNVTIEDWDKVAIKPDFGY